MKFIKLNVVICIFFTSLMAEGDFAYRPTSYPYISGDTFRAMCDFVLDRDYFSMKPNTNQTLSFDPMEVKKADLIFVDIGNLEEFFSYYHPKIMEKYILISHNDDGGVPGKFKKYLDDEKLHLWFSQNIEEVHEKLIPIPIGLSNKHWPWSDDHDLITNKVEKIAFKIKKNYLLYFNFTIETNSAVRKPIFDLFINKGYTFHKRAQYRKYLLILAQHKFALSPRGNGLDCHRTWECLYVGTIPIVKSSAMDSVFQGLPVLIIDDWNIVNDEFLTKKHLEFSKKHFSREKLYHDFWKKMILDHKNILKNS